MTRDLQCPLCGGGKLTSWGSKRGYSLFNCSNCGHGFADLRGMEFSRDPDEFLEEFTHGTMPTDEDYYHHLAGGEAPGNTVVIASGHALRLAEACGSTGSWLDVGSGSGHLVASAQAAHYEAQGIEPGGWGQISAREKNISVRQGFLEADSFSQQFDIVSATDVVEHQTDPISFLKLLAGYVKPNGYLILSIPYADSPEAKILGAKWNMVAPPTHNQFFSKKSLDFALEQIGFSIKARQQYHVHHRLSRLLRYKASRQILEALIPGPQLMCIAYRTSDWSVPS